MLERLPSYHVLTEVPMVDIGRRSLLPSDGIAPWASPAARSIPSAGEAGGCGNVGQAEFTHAARCHAPGVKRPEGRRAPTTAIGFESALHRRDWIARGRMTGIPFAKVSTSSGHKSESTPFSRRRRRPRP